MTLPWPATDVVRDMQVSADGAVARARTRLYLQGARDHIHTTTILIAADLLLRELLPEGEELPDIVELQNRNLSNRDLILTTSDSADRIERADAPALRGSFRTARGRTFHLEATVTDDEVTRRCEPAGIFHALMERMHLAESRDDLHRTRLDPLGPVWSDGADPIRARHALVELVLEGTRELIRRRFGSLDGFALVVAGWRGFVFPRWSEVARGCVLEYRLADGKLSSGARLVHCDFGFAPGEPAGRLTIAEVPAQRMAALAR